MITPEMCFGVQEFLRRRGFTEDQIRNQPELEQMWAEVQEMEVAG